MLIIGAGISGLLAGQYFRHLNPTIIEVQDSLPNNHSALLRFRSDAVSRLTGIPFRKVTVRKSIYLNGLTHDHPVISASNQYSMKVHGDLRSRSIDNLDTCERYIAPHDFIEKASRGLDISYGCEYSPLMASVDDNHVISTIPMESMCGALGIDEHPELKHKPIWTANAYLNRNSDIYQTIYYPEISNPMYRMSITGRRVTAEFIRDSGNHLEHVNLALEKEFGISERVNVCKYKEVKYGKLIEYQGNFVKEMIKTLTDDYGIYSLGRWATHRQILSDDVVNDIHVIDRMIRSENYKR